MNNISALFILFCLTGFSQKNNVSIDSENDIMLFVLAGQSNMAGYGHNKDLPKTLDTTFDDVWIFQGNTADDEALDGGLGKWEALRPGHGVGFSSNGKVNEHSDKFGVELSFAKKMKKHYPNRKIAIIKYAKPGSSIDSLAKRTWGHWEPDYQGTNGINQYDHFLNTLKNAIGSSDLDNDGKMDVLIPSGIIWFQGTSDSFISEEVAKKYGNNLKRLMDLFRAALHFNDLPIVLGKVSDSGDDPDGKVWEYLELVQHGQEQLVRKDEYVTIVRSTRKLNYSDPWHYDSEGYIKLGELFADAYYDLMTPKKINTQ